MENNVIHYSNCQLEQIQIQFSHQWIIPDFGKWVDENPGQWLNDQPFSPIQGIQLQLKILGSPWSLNGNVRIFLKNCKPKPINLTTFKISYSAMTEDGDYKTHPESGYFPSLALTEELKLCWSERDDWDDLPSRSLKNKLNGNAGKKIC